MLFSGETSVDGAVGSVVIFLGEVFRFDLLISKVNELEGSLLRLVLALFSNSGKIYECLSYPSIILNWFVESRGLSALLMTI